MKGYSTNLNGVWSKVRGRGRTVWPNVMTKIDEDPLESMKGHMTSVKNTHTEQPENAIDYTLWRSTSCP